MKDFIAFLQSSKSFLETISSKSQSIHITLGNESCDLDSTISALIWGYFLSKREPNTTIIPVLNVSHENFLLRTENCFALREAGVLLTDLVYRDQINFQQLISKNSVTTSLVDHHVLSKNDEILAAHVLQIFDHRPEDPDYKWDQNKVKIRIEPVGSCCTLIVDEIMKNNSGFLNKSLAYLLYETIIYDTIALRPENGKATPLDIEMGTLLEKKYDFGEERQKLFDTLWTAHNDVSQLTNRQLLLKDLKIVEGVYVPGLPMLAEDYLKREGAYEAVVQFACEHKVTCVLLIGLNASNAVRRDLAIYSTTAVDKLQMALLKTFNANEEYDFQFEERSTAFSETIKLLHMHNTKLSRKHLVPLVKQTLRDVHRDK